MAKRQENKRDRQNSQRMKKEWKRDKKGSHSAEGQGKSHRLLEFNALAESSKIPKQDLAIFTDKGTGLDTTQLNRLNSAAGGAANFLQNRSKLYEEACDMGYPGVHL